MIFKKFPFAGTSEKDPAARDAHFIEKFIESNSNTYKIKISQKLLSLLKGMLQFENAERLSLSQVLNSEWFVEKLHELKTDEAAAEEAKKTLYNKMGYVHNLTKVRLNLRELGLVPLNDSDIGRISTLSSSE